MSQTSNWIDTVGNCMICGEIGGHGNLPCPKLEVGPPQTGRIEFGPYPEPRPAGAEPVDIFKRSESIDQKLDCIIELLEQLVPRED